MKRSFAVIVVLAGLIFASSAYASPDAGQIVIDAIEYLRGTSSVIDATLKIHRPDWERTSSFRSWTKGDDNSLVRFIAPAKDAGSATLKMERNMWSFSPKISKVVKIPPSMMGQSWMGSDFSYNDLSRAQDLKEYYDHKLLEESAHEGKKVFVIESIPKENAPVVWGKEILKIREDRIILEHDFYTQELTLFKRLTAREITTLGGKLYPRYVRMQKVENSDEWTEISHEKVAFDVKMPESVFSLMSLSNPGGLPQ